MYTLRERYHGYRVVLSKISDILENAEVPMLYLTYTPTEGHPSTIEKTPLNAYLDLPKLFVFVEEVDIRASQLNGIALLL
jgi:hypothetical protein